MSDLYLERTFSINGTDKHLSTFLFLYETRFTRDARLVHERDHVGEVHHAITTGAGARRRLDLEGRLGLDARPLPRHRRRAGGGHRHATVRADAIELVGIAAGIDRRHGVGAVGPEQRDRPRESRRHAGAQRQTYAASVRAEVMIQRMASDVARSGRTSTGT